MRRAIGSTSRPVRSPNTHCSSSWDGRASSASSGTSTANEVRASSRPGRRTTRRRILIVRAFDRGGASGYGECVAGENPFFNHETIDTAWLITAKYVAPLLKAARVESAAQVSHALTPIRENRMAKAGVEAAIWDLEAKIAQAPLWQHIKGTREEITCGVSIGLQSSIEALLDKVSREVESGYQRIKIKIKPGQDVALVEAVRKQFPDITLSVDANSAYRLETDEEQIERDQDQWAVCRVNHRRVGL